MPWLNRVDLGWMRELVEPFGVVVTVDNQSPVGGLGDVILRSLAANDLLRSRRVWTFAVDEYPVCGDTREVLRHHRLDAVSVASRVLEVARAVGLAAKVGAVIRTVQGHDADAAIG